jgi:hypothetical protein
LLRWNGKKEECKYRLSKLVERELGPTIQDLEARGYKINRQPCFHYNDAINQDALIINAISSAAIGQNIIALQNQGELVPSCNCLSRSIESCKNRCVRVAGIATVASAFIPNRKAQAAVLYALVEFGIECSKCCEISFGSDNCFKTLKNLIQAIGESQLKEDGIW